jgi:hypothetical protein
MAKGDSWSESAVSGNPGPTPPPIEGITREAGGRRIEARSDLPGSPPEERREERPATGESVGQAAKEQVVTMVRKRKERASERLGSVTKALRGVGRELREQDQRAAAVVIEKIAQRIERLSNQFRAKDIEEIARDMGQAARQRPVLVFGIAFAAGLLAVRMLKSAS